MDLKALKLYKITVTWQGCFYVVANSVISASQLVENHIKTLDLDVKAERQIESIELISENRVDIHILFADQPMTFVDKKIITERDINIVEDKDNIDDLYWLRNSNGVKIVSGPLDPNISVTLNHTASEPSQTSVTPAPEYKDSDVEDNKGCVKIEYTNYRGEFITRNILPGIIYFGCNEWHTEVQWLLEAYELDKQAKRCFAMKDIKKWCSN